VAAPVSIDDHVRRIVRIHFDPAHGAPYWLERRQRLGFDPIEEIHGLDDLRRLGPMCAGDLCRRSVMDFVPLSRRHRLAGAIVTETGGTTGRPKRTVFSGEEFRAAFVEPFVRVATATGFPRSGAWLWVGPGGPHVIGQAAAACAAALDSPQPFAVDLDPRWFRKLPAGSMARRRYLRHVLDQAIEVLNAEPIEVIFTTPALLETLAEAMTAVQRRRIRGVHYGGMRVSPELLRSAQGEWFPEAVHLAGYGNSLFGVCMELGGPPDRRLRYYPLGPRHQVRVGEDGRVWMSRLDETVLIANLRERDAAAPVPPPGADWAEFGAGVADPHPAGDTDSQPHAGIY